MDRIKQWKSQGRFRPSFVLKQIGSTTARYRSARLPSGTKKLSEEEFTSLLLTVGGLPSSCRGMGHYVYQIIAYLSTAPFYERKHQESLTIAEIYRAMAWLVPNHMRTGSNGGRTRTPADERRLLFQSLATATSNNQHDPAKERERSHRNAISMPETAYRDPNWLITNYSDDGDEMFNDVLDTLFIFQPGSHGYPPQGPVSRQGFTEIAKELVEERDRFKLHTLAIPLDEFTSFVKFLLALQFQYEGGQRPDLSLFRESATQVANSFRENQFSTVIDWPKFDDTLPQMPYLFDPLRRVLARLLWLPNRVEMCPLREIPMPQRDSFMTAPHLSQLGLILNKNLHFETFLLANRFNRGVRPTAEVLLKAVEMMSVLSVWFFKGFSSSGERFIFGAFFNPAPSLPEFQKMNDDGIHAMFRGLSVNDDPNERHLDVYPVDAVHNRFEYRGAVSQDARPHIFVLAPAQRVVCFGGGGPRLDGNRLCFGDALSLSDDGVATINYGDRAVRVMTTSVEIWGQEFGFSTADDLGLGSIDWEWSDDEE